MNLDQIKNPRTRMRVQQALRAAGELKHEIKTHCPLPSPQPKPIIRHEPLAESEGTKKSTSRIVLRITSFRKRLIDPDNLCAKSLVDGCRYAGLLANDRPQDIELTVAQEKCAKKDERTEIELIIPDQ